MNSYITKIKENEKLAAHYSYICEYSKRFNLMAKHEIEKGYYYFIQNHVLDALQALELDISWTNAMVADVGSGSGLPGIPLAIVLHQEIKSMALIEATAKKAGFLSTVSSGLGLNTVKIINERAENVSRMHEYREYFDIVTTRAVGYIDECMELTLPMTRLGGSVLLYRGEISEREECLSNEVANIFGGKLEKIVNYSLENIEKPRHIMVIRKTEKTDEKYPRAPGKPKKHSIFKNK